MKEVHFKSTKDGMTLHGVITIPKQKLRGAVLMLVGSGKVDRDETTPADMTFSGKPEKLFSQLSDSLVSAGFATFRYDKRGVLDSEGNVDSKIWETADRDHLISDATDAAHVLLKELHLSAKEIILLGHSEGTIIATEVAINLGGSVRALLLFGAQARSMKDMLHYQVVESRSKHASGNGKQEGPKEEYKKALEMIATSKDKFAPDGKPMGWYRQHFSAPANAERLAAVTGKKFIFQGELDPQTPIDEVDRFKKAGVTDLTVHRYSNLGHGFSPDKNGKPTLGPIDEKVIADLLKVVQQI